MHLLHLVREILLADFDLDHRLVEIARTGQLDHEVRRGAVHPQQRFLNLGREHVHAADDHHVVGTPLDPAHPDRGASTGALVVVKPRKVAGAVADDRTRLLGQAGDHQFALLALGDRFKGVGVQARDQNIVLLDVHAGAGRAFAGDAGADDFGETVVVEGVDAQLFLNGAAHLFRPRLAAEVGEPEREVPFFQPLALNGFREVQGVGGGADQCVDPGVLEQHDLPLGVAAGGGQHRRADPFDAAVQPEAAGEEAVTEGNLYELVAGQAACNQEAGAEIGPELHILFGVADEGRLAGGAARSVDAGEFAPGHRKEAEGIGVAEVLLGGERETLQVGDGFDRIRRDVLFRELAPVERNLLSLFNGAPQMGGLELGPVGARHTLGGRVEDPVGNDELRHFF